MTVVAQAAYNQLTCICTALDSTLFPDSLPWLSDSGGRNLNPKAKGEVLGIELRRIPFSFRA